MDSALEKPRLDWGNIVFLGFVHTLAVLAVVYSIWFVFSWYTVLLAVAYSLFSGVSITGGYHRLFSHKAYKAHPALQLFYLIFGAAAVQNSAYKWSIDHRIHHSFTDEEKDPYNIKKGFWWAHIGWVLYKDVGIDQQYHALGSDLSKNKLVMWQHRNYVLLVVLTCAVLPFCLGLLWGDPIGAFLWVMGLRLFLLYHSTFFINSLAHTLGSQPYSKRTSAKDSFITALVSMGEGYHNFHHQFPSDYRNGVRFFHFDPTKWWIKSLSKVGVTWDLKKTPHDKIEVAKKQTLLS